jgi:hypothetical protein
MGTGELSSAVKAAAAWVCTSPNVHVSGIMGCYSHVR